MATFWLCKNIPFNNSYDNVVDFENQGQQQSYFIGLSDGPITSNNFRISDEAVAFNVERAYELCTELNYMVLLQGGRYHYIFIDTIAYVDTQTTRLVGTLDVYQTYQFDHTIADAFIGREHQDRFNTNLEPIYNLEKENIELGEVYETISTATGIDNYKGNQEILWYYVVTTEKMGNNSDPNNEYNLPLKVGGINTGFYLYTFPMNKDGKNTSIEYTPTNKVVTFYTRRDIGTLLSDPRVISIYASPYGPTTYTLNDVSGLNNQTISNLKDLDEGTTSDNYIVKLTQPDTLRMLSVGSLQNVKKDFEFGHLKAYNTFNLVVDKPRDMSLEPKLNTKPFKLYSFTNRTNEPLDLGANEFNNIISYIESFGVQYKNIMYADKLDPTNFFNSIQSTKNNELPLTSDRYINYIMNNKASATTGVALNVAGAVGGAIASQGPSPFSYMGTMLGISNSQKVIGELLQRSDLKQAPKSIRETGNNIVMQLQVDPYNLLLACSIRRPLKQFVDRAYEHLYRNGYKANRFGIPNLKSRYYFNFVELIDVTISGNLSQNVKTKLETIYKNGVRLWHYKGSTFKMYDYTKENVEVNLV